MVVVRPSAYAATKVDGQSRVLRGTLKARSETPRRTLHFLLRYSDSLRQVDTYAAHKIIAERFGYVWWGKFGVGVGRPFVEIPRQQIMSGTATYVYLATKRTVLYRARLLAILGGGTSALYRPKDSNRIPSYYRGERCSVWFKLTEFCSLSSQLRKRLVLYNSPTFAPELNGMRGLIYVTHGAPIKRDASHVSGVDAEERNSFEVEYPSLGALHSDEAQEHLLRELL